MSKHAREVSISGSTSTMKERYRKLDALIMGGCVLLMLGVGRDSNDCTLQHHDFGQEGCTWIIVYRLLRTTGLVS